MRVTLWPEPYSVARLRALPASLPPCEAAGPPVALVVGAGEVSVLGPAAWVAALDGVEHVLDGWRAVSLDAVLPPTQIGVLAEISRVLAVVGVPILAFSSHDTDHFLVPADRVGRALAALHQADLDRLLAPS